MNILMHCVYFPPEVGGLESHVHNLCRGLVSRGHRVHVVTSRSQPGLPGEERVGGIHVSRTWFPGRNPAGWVLHSLCSAPRTVRAGAGADVIHAQGFRFDSPRGRGLSPGEKAPGDDHPYLALPPDGS